MLKRQRVVSYSCRKSDSPHFWEFIARLATSTNHPPIWFSYSKKRNLRNIWRRFWPFWAYLGYFWQLCRFLIFLTICGRAVEGNYATNLLSPLVENIQNHPHFFLRSSFSLKSWSSQNNGKLVNYPNERKFGDLHFPFDLFIWKRLDLKPGWKSATVSIWFQIATQRKS